MGQLLWSSTTSATAESAGKSQVHKPAASDSDAPMKATQTFPTTTVTDLVAQATNGLAGQTSVAVMPLTGSQTVVLNNRAQRAGSLITLFIMVTAFDQVHQNNRQHAGSLYPACCR
ncbi:hypothetical protein [Lactiplantibacillus plantarum]|uniref:hypothetical protein n=1 Tax=Lactiplantibacillus plantarum TaxID=1590 RepID=UPI0021CB82D5|nr:hypothetical protein [Lactiplantibacillus plantarum]